MATPTGTATSLPASSSQAVPTDQQNLPAISRAMPDQKKEGTDSDKVLSVEIIVGGDEVKDKAHSLPTEAKPEQHADRDELRKKKEEGQSRAAKDADDVERSTSSAKATVTDPPGMVVGSGRVGVPGHLTLENNPNRVMPRYQRNDETFSQDAYDDMVSTIDLAMELHFQAVDDEEYAKAVEAKRQAE